LNLKEFITETISAIAEATSDLQAKYASEGILINPPAPQSGGPVYQPGSPNYTMRRVQNIQFDVAVTAASETAGGGKAGIKVLSMEIGGSGERTTSSEQVSRVKFEIPLTLKPSEDEKDNTVAKAARQARSPKVITSRSGRGA
jgi:Trypsin-co-occurring domain 2